MCLNVENTNSSEKHLDKTQSDVDYYLLFWKFIEA